MNEPLNGKAQEVGVNVSVTPLSPSSAQLNYTTSDGQYLGSVTFNTCHPNALKIMGDHFQQFAAQQTGGIQIANGLPGGLRTS